jgi:hypothetical protein
MLVNFMWPFLFPNMAVVSVYVMSKMEGNITCVYHSPLKVVINCDRHQVGKFKFYVPICMFDFMKNLNFASMQPLPLLQEILDCSIR